MRDIHTGERGSETLNHACVSLEYPASGERQDRPEPVPVQNSSRVDLWVGCILRDGWTKERYTKEVLDWYRGDDAGDLRRNEFNEEVASMTPLNAFSEHNWKSEKSNPNIVMNENLVKNNVMDAKIDPKVVMELSIFKVGGRNNLQPSNQK